MPASTTYPVGKVMGRTTSGFPVYTLSTQWTSVSSRSKIIVLLFSYPGRLAKDMALAFMILGCYYGRFWTNLIAWKVLKRWSLYINFALFCISAGDNATIGSWFISTTGFFTFVTHYERGAASIGDGSCYYAFSALTVFFLRGSSEGYRGILAMAVGVIAFYVKFISILVFESLGVWECPFIEILFSSTRSRARFRFILLLGVAGENGTGRK